MTTLQRTRSRAKKKEPQQSLQLREPVVPEASGFVKYAEVPSAKPTGRKIFGFAILALVLGAIGAQIGFFGASAFDEEWKARAEVQYRGSAWTETQNIAVQSRSIAQPVANTFGIPIKDFEEDLEAGLVPGTQIVRIDFVSTDPEEAEAIVDALSVGYIAEVSEIQPPQGREILEAEIVDLREQLVTAQADLAEFSRDDSTAGQVQQQVTQSLISSLRARIDDFELRILDGELTELDSTENGVPFVVTTPFVFEDAVFPRPKLMAALGAVAGIVLASMAFLIYWNVLSWRRSSAVGAW